MEYRILRPGNVYGPGQDPHGEAGVVAIFGKRMLANDDVTIYGDGEQQRDYVHVRDVVEAAVVAALSASADATVFNIASGAPTTVNEIFALLAEATGYEKSPDHAEERPGDVRNIYLDITRAKDVLGWKPRTST